MEAFQEIMEQKPKNIINMIKIFKICKEESVVIAALEHWKLIPTIGEFMCPRCSRPLKRGRSGRTDLGHKWYCNRMYAVKKKKAQRCSTHFSLRVNTFFGGSKATVENILLFVHLWTRNASMGFIRVQLGVTPAFAANWNSYCREIVLHLMLNQQTKLGGPGTTVEIRESKFDTRNFNSLHYIESFYAYGCYERQSGKYFMVKVENCDKSTLLPIINERILPWTRIISDLWKEYDCLNDEGYQQLEFNNSITFCSPGTDSTPLWVANQYCQKESNAGSLAKHLFLKYCRKNNIDPCAEFLRVAGKLYNPMQPESDIPCLNIENW